MTKIGMDDAFAAGMSVEGLLALAEPWNGRGPGITLQDTHETVDDEVAALQTRVFQLELDLAQAKEDARALVELINHPEFTLTQIRIATASAILPRAKASHGEIDTNGDAVISAAEFSGDWRPKPGRRESLAPTNQDGTRPKMPRSTVKPQMEWAIEHELIVAKSIPVDRSHVGGAAWRDTAFAVKPKASIAAALNPWITYRPDAPKVRKPRTTAQPCPACGEVHPIKRKDILWVDCCTGCGAIVDKATDSSIAPEQATHRPVETGDTLSPVSEPPSPPSPRPIGRQTISGLPEEPTWVSEAPEVALDEPTDLDDAALSAPPLHEVQEVLKSADHAAAGDARRALQDVEAQLAREAVKRGRRPAPKPRSTPIVPAVAPSDSWDAPHQWGAD